MKGRRRRIDRRRGLHIRSTPSAFQGTAVDCHLRVVGTGKSMLHSLPIVQDVLGCMAEEEGSLSNSESGHGATFV